MNETQIAAGIRRQVIAKYGFEPNLISKLLLSPQVARTYLSGMEFLEQSSLTPKDIHAAALIVSVFNECHYCTAAHSAVCLRLGVSVDDVARMRQNQRPSEPRLAGLFLAVTKLLEKKGFLDASELDALAKAGITQRQIHELIAIISLKTITNYINHIEQTELNSEFTKPIEEAGIVQSGALERGFVGRGSTS